jgi:hypothetical protein
VNAVFAEDHPVPALRGRRRLEPKKVRLLLLGRSRWLQGKIEERRLAAMPFDWAVEELAAIEQTIETL